MNEIDFQHWSFDLFIAMGASETLADQLTLGVDLFIILLVSFIGDRLARLAIMRLVHRIVQRTKNDWDDIFYEKKVFNALSHVIPAWIITWSTDFVLKEYADVVTMIDKWVFIYVIFIIGLVVTRVLRAIGAIVHKSEYFEGKPVASFLQLFQIVNYIIIGVLILSQLIGKSPLTVLGAFGAGTAVLLLIFRDTILGLVASIQISLNDMVRAGDWVSMPKYGADGDVIEINLTTVKVKNWDKTISTVPTYAFVSDSFKNWRGMSNDGVRRIKRHLLIDMQSIVFIDPQLKTRLENYSLLKEYLVSRQTEIDAFNEAKKVDKKEVINGRQMTNVGVFRKYAEEYLLQNKLIDTNQTLMVRQLQPTELGLPLEIYCFSTTTAWVEYEGIISDIFDHLIAAAPYFGLHIYQAPSGMDFRKISPSNPS